MKYLEDGTKVRVSRGIGASESIIPRPEILKIRTTPRPAVGIVHLITTHYMLCTLLHVCNMCLGITQHVLYSAHYLFLCSLLQLILQLVNASKN